MRSRVLVATMLGLLGLVLVGADPIAQSDDPETLIDDAEALAPQRYQPDVMEQMVDLYEQILSQLDSLERNRQEFVLNRLSQLHYERAILRDGMHPQDRDALDTAREFGFRSLRLNADFETWEDRDFPKALSFIDDPRALLWAGDAWGQIFQLNPLEGLTNVGSLAAMYRRCLKIDEDVHGAGCHRSLGALLVATPGWLGGNADAGTDHLERAIEAAPDYLQNRMVYAEYWGFSYDGFGNKNGIRDRALIEEQLRVVEGAPVGDWPFWNRIAKREVARLRDELQRFARE